MDGKFVFYLILVICLFALGPLITMWLWNWLMPELFDLKVITYWQALGLLILSSCFFYRGK
jgi:hypothetical protein